MVRLLSFEVFREMIALLSVGRPINLPDHRICFWSFEFTKL
jgi:hypothetical protein